MEKRCCVSAGKIISRVSTAFFAVLIAFFLVAAERSDPVTEEISRLVECEIDAVNNRAAVLASADMAMSAGDMVEYGIVCETEDAVSFVIQKNIPDASPYGQVCYYNIDPDTGLHLTLEDIFGKDYKQTVWDAVEPQIKMQERLYPGIDAEPMINLNRMFYLKDCGKTAVIVFDVGEIADEDVGMVEYEVAVNSNTAGG